VDRFRESLGISSRPSSQSIRPSRCRKFVFIVSRANRLCGVREDDHHMCGRSGSQGTCTRLVRTLACLTLKPCLLLEVVGDGKTTLLESPNANLADASGARGEESEGIFQS
jgi:hypothetical protein